MVLTNLKAEIMHGYFEGNRIYTDIEVYGFSKETKQSFKAEIDTGYDGYLSIPITQAFPLGLILTGTKSYTLADESRTSNLVCMGSVLFGEESHIIPIDVMPKGSVLIGTALLAIIKKEIRIDYINKKVRFLEGEAQKK